MDIKSDIIPLTGCAAACFLILAIAIYGAVIAGLFYLWSVLVSQGSPEWLATCFCVWIGLALYRIERLRKTTNVNTSA